MYVSSSVATSPKICSDQEFTVPTSPVARSRTVKVHSPTLLSPQSWVVENVQLILSAPEPRSVLLPGAPLVGFHWGARCWRCGCCDDSIDDGAIELDYCLALTARAGGMGLMDDASDHKVSAYLHATVGPFDALVKPSFGGGPEVRRAQVVFGGALATEEEFAPLIDELTTLASRLNAPRDDQHPAQSSAKESLEPIEISVAGLAHNPNEIAELRTRILEHIQAFQIARRSR